MTVTILKRRIKDRSVKVAIAGMGYVGLPLAKSISNSGIHKIFGIDINENKVSNLSSGKSDIESVSDNDLQKMLNYGFKPTKSFSCLKKQMYLLSVFPHHFQNQMIPIFLL